MNIRLVGVRTLGLFYEKALRPVFFKFDSEKVHTRLTDMGAAFGALPFIAGTARSVFGESSPMLAQEHFGLHFPGPVGLSAGFDYEAKLTQITYGIGFGFHTVGTITDKPYEGNIPPRLGRLPKSRSLLVNKGFKNRGIDAIETECAGLTFKIPVGLSIGKTNSREPMTQAEAVADVVAAFTKAEQGSVPWNYYELNISCPNL